MGKLYLILETKLSEFCLIDYHVNKFNLGKFHTVFCGPMTGGANLDFIQFCFAVLSRSVVSNSLWPDGLQPTRLLCPWDSPGKNTGVGCHALLQGIFPTREQNPGLPHCRQILYCLIHQGDIFCFALVLYKKERKKLIRLYGWFWFHRTFHHILPLFTLSTDTFSSTFCDKYQKEKNFAEIISPTLSTLSNQQLNSNNMHMQKTE